MVDVEQLEHVDPGLVEHFEVLRGNFITRFDPDAASALVDEILGGIAAEDFLGRNQQVLQAVLGRLVGGARADLGAGGKHDFA